MTHKTMIAAVLAAGLLLATPASAHDGENGRMLRGMIGGLFGAVSQALCRGNCPPAYYPPPYYPPPAGNDYAPMPPAPMPPAPPPQSPPSDPDIAFVQHALNMLDRAGLVEDGVGGPATKAALLGYLGNQMRAAGQS